MPYSQISLNFFYTALAREKLHCELIRPDHSDFNDLYYNSSTNTLTIGWTRPLHKNITEYILDYVRVHSDNSASLHHQTTTGQSIQIPSVDVSSHYYFTLRGILADGRETNETQYCLSHHSDISSLTSCKYICMCSVPCIIACL